MLPLSAQKMMVKAIHLLADNSSDLLLNGMVHSKQEMFKAFVCQALGKGLFILHFEVVDSLLTLSIKLQDLLSGRTIYDEKLYEDEGHNNDPEPTVGKRRRTTKTKKKKKQKDVARWQSLIPSDDEDVPPPITVQLSSREMDMMSQYMESNTSSMDSMNINSDAHTDELFGPSDGQITLDILHHF